VLDLHDAAGVTARPDRRRGTARRGPGRGSVATRPPASAIRTRGGSAGPIRRRRAVARALRLLPALALAACATTLPYTPARQPSGVTLSADFRLAEDRLHVEIESDGYRVEQAALVREDGTEVAPEALVPAPARGGGPTFGIGIGAGGWSGGGSYSIGTGIGIPIGGPRPGTTTLAVFRLAEAGTPPWRIRVKVVGVEPTDIVLDPARPGGA
jgi:hypothetical protein